MARVFSSVQTSRVTVKEAISAACGMTGLFGYVGATLSGVGLAYITASFGWMAMYGVCVVSSILCLILVLMTYKKEKGHS